MQSDTPAPTDPLHGNNLSGLLNCALDASTIPVSVSEFPENWEPPTPDHIAVLLPQYQIESLIGRGGMGAVYKGRQITLQRPVAIKVLPAELARNTEFVARFHREAQLLASLSHQGIVTIFDFGQTAEGHLYFVMEYVDGTDLYRLIQKSGKPLDAKRALSLTVQICEAMQYAHDKGVVHRDIKPANVLVTRDGRAKLADFGLAMKPADPDAMPVPPKPGAYFDPQLSPNAADMRFTQPGAAMGTPDYAAPEVYDGKADERSDIYALGIMLYEMLTGAPPKGYFQLPSVIASVDHRVDQVVVRALEIDPAARYQKASDMQQAVEAATRPLPKRSQIKLPPTVPSRPAVSSSAKVRPPTQVPQRPRPSGWFGKLVVAALVILSVAAAYDAGQKWTMAKRLLALVPVLHKMGFGRSEVTSTQETVQARAWLDEAKAELTKLQPGQVKDRIAKDLSAAYAKAALFDSAFTLVPLIGDVNPRGRALVQIATEQASNGDFAAALKTAEQAPDSTARGLALVAVAGAQMRQGDEVGARATAAKTSNTAATALFRVEEAVACQRRTDPDGFRDKIQQAVTFARTLTEQGEMKQAFKAIVVAQTKAGYLNEAKTTATLYSGHRFGAPLLDIIDAQAEMGDFKGAEASFASSGFTMYPACLAVASIADAMADAGRHADAEANAKRLWYEDHKLAALANVATKAGKLSAARAAAAAILTSDHLDGDRSERYARALAPTAALQAKLEGDAAAATWARKLPDPVARCLSFIALAESKLPRRDTHQVKPIASVPFKSLTTPAPIPTPPAPRTIVSEQGFTLLLDKDHQSGWKYVGAGEVKNDNGTFSVWHPHPHSRDAGMYWYAARTFADFVLRLQFMTTDGEVNSGIFLRTPALRDGPQSLWIDGSYEIEIKGRETGAIPWVKPKPDLTLPFKVNTWNDYEIMVQGQDYSVKLNGVLINKFTGNRNTSGYIAIQSFTDKANAFRFCNVRIQELGTPQPLALDAAAAPVEPLWLTNAKRRGGRLRVQGSCRGYALAVPEQDDFVEVYAKRDVGYAAKRANGELVYCYCPEGGPGKLGAASRVKAVSMDDEVLVTSVDGAVARLESRGLVMFDNTMPDETAGAVSLNWGHFLLNEKNEVLREFLINREKRKDTPIPKNHFAGAIQVLSGNWVATALFPDSEPKGWSLHPADGVNIPYPKFLSGCIQADAFCSDIILLRNKRGQVFASDCAPEGHPVTAVAHPPSILPPALRVRGGCDRKDRNITNVLCTAQMQDGTWRAWGHGGNLADKVNQLGRAIDLDATSASSSAGFLVWIELVN